jgi:hypothetical protein
MYWSNPCCHAAVANVDGPTGSIKAIGVTGYCNSGCPAGNCVGEKDQDGNFVGECQ